VASGIEARRWRRIQAAAETVSDPVLNPRREGGIFCCSHADSLPRLMAAPVGEGPAPRQRASVEPPLKCRSAFQSLRSAGQDSRGVRIPEAWRSSGRVRMPSPRLFLSAAQEDRYSAKAAPSRKSEAGRQFPLTHDQNSPARRGRSVQGGVSLRRVETPKARRHREFPGASAGNCLRRILRL